MILLCLAETCIALAFVGHLNIALGCGTGKRYQDVALACWVFRLKWTKAGIMMFMQSLSYLHSMAKCYDKTHSDVRSSLLVDD